MRRYSNNTQTAQSPVRKRSFYMKILFFISLSVFPLASVCQNKEDLKISIDSIVESIDISRSKVVQFKIVALKKVFHRISYEYQTQKGQIIKIERRYAHREDSITQTFYLKTGQLIYSVERIVSHYGNDSIVWSGKFYFSKGKLIDHRTLGHGKSETDNWDPETDLKMALFESRRDIARHNKIKNGG